MKDNLMAEEKNNTADKIKKWAKEQWHKFAAKYGIPHDVESITGTKNGVSGSSPAVEKIAEQFRGTTTTQEYIGALPPITPAVAPSKGTVAGAGQGSR